MTKALRIQKIIKVLKSEGEWDKIWGKTCFYKQLRAKYLAKNKKNWAKM